MQATTLGGKGPSGARTRRDRLPEPGTRQPAKIVIVDDHPIIRAAIGSILGGSGDWRVVGEAGAAREALVLVDTHQPDLVLLDLVLPGMDGVIATREIRRRSPGTRILIFTGHEQIADIRDAFRAGASGYVVKADVDGLVPAVSAALRGERYLSPVVASRYAATEPGPEAGPGAAADASRDVLASLSEREREVFRLAADCLTTQEIARELCISRKTVDTHLYRIHRKLGLRNAAELVRFATGLGLSPTGRTRERGAQPPVREQAGGSRTQT